MRGRKASEQLLSQFSRCDAQFFQSLNTAQLPAATLTVAKYGAVSAPKVLNPLQEGGRYQAFEQPLLVNGVSSLLAGGGLWMLSLAMASGVKNDADGRG